MTMSAKLLFSLFFLLALVAVGHDIYIWYNSDDYPFEFAALGWISKKYISDIHQMVVDVLTPETFNTVLTPILKIPAFFLTSGIATGVFVIDFIFRKVKSLMPEPKWDNNKNTKFRR